ncbi:MAG: metal-dependent hydrolase [Candidatus Woesebacteria bacterium]|nr:MAG: metal-dependent hydrolase [Candidatus Woesebacteria bacterium]
MTARTHNAFAFASLVTAAAYFPPTHLNLSTLILGIVGTDIGALIPDMDTGGNYLWGLLPQGQKLGGFLRRIFYKHRTITHSLLGLFLIFKFFAWLLPRIFNSTFIDPQIILVSIMIGFVSHLIADSFTEEGIPLLYPIPLTFGIPPIKKVRIKTGHWFENFVIFPGIWIFLIWFVNIHKDIFLQILRGLI